MANMTPPPSEEEEQNVVANPWRKQNFTPDKVKQVISAPLAGCAWIANNQPILPGGIFSKVGQCFGVTQQQPHITYNTAVAVVCKF
jgi:hypothetical protein